MKKIWLSGKTGEGKYTLVDDEDYIYLSPFRWYLNNSGYATRSIWKNKCSKTIMLHTVVLWCPKGYMRDHISGDRLDNRKCNLRIATEQQNCFHKTKFNALSGYKGVKKYRKKWFAVISKNNQQMHIGAFDTPKEAALAYNNKAIDLFGEFACLNVL